MDENQSTNSNNETIKSTLLEDVSDSKVESIINDFLTKRKTKTKKTNDENIINALLERITVLENSVKEKNNNSTTDEMLKQIANERENQRIENNDMEEFANIVSYIANNVPLESEEKSYLESELTKRKTVAEKKDFAERFVISFSGLDTSAEKIDKNELSTYFKLAKDKIKNERMLSSDGKLIHSSTGEVDYDKWMSIFKLPIKKRMESLTSNLI